MISTCDGPTTRTSRRTRVQGLYAKVRCFSSIWLIYGVIEIGDDPAVDPVEPDPIEISATLSDVRVLLRAN